MVKEAIKIYLRLKPILKSEKSRLKETKYEVDADSEGHPRVKFVLTKDLQSEGLINNKKENYKFRFSKIFNVDALQDEVFNAVAKPVIDNVLSGYNGTIFAYGQTGSGKTYSIVGDCSYNDRGIIPRTLSYIFDYFDQHPECEFTVSESYLEIYNERGFDLFDTSRDTGKLEDLRRVKLFEDSSGGIHLRNLSVHTVNSYEEALPLFLTGDTNRMMAETVMNKVSTRSHCIFTIHVTSREPGSATVRRAKLHLVDLAGSERPSKTGTDGQLLTEAQYINKSLHYLEQVIVALSEQNRQHVPYRNSMMTSVLRDSLGGNCMTSMIATVSTDRTNLMESISTCRFAQRVALIKNDAILNEELDPQVMIARLKHENDLLRGELSKFTDDRPDGDLSSEDKERCERAVIAYLEERGPESTPSGDIISDTRKIIFFCQCLKRRILEKPEVVSKTDPRADSAPVTSEPVEDSSWQHPAYNREMKSLQDCILQRDNEINILVSMLKKEKRRAAEAISRAVGGPPRHPIDDLPAPRMSAPQADATEQRVKERVLGKMSMGREEAYELFKRDFDADNQIDEAKATLRQRCSEAKQIGQQMIEARNTSNRLAEMIKKHRLHQSLHRQQVGESFSEADDEVAADAEEVRLRGDLERTTKVFKSSVRRLKELKSEIEHRKHLIETMNVRLVQAFQNWWSEQEQQQQQQQPVDPSKEPQAWQTPPVTPQRPSPLPAIPPSSASSSDSWRPPNRPVHVPPRHINGISDRAPIPPVASTPGALDRAENSVPYRVAGVPSANHLAVGSTPGASDRSLHSALTFDLPERIPPTASPANHLISGANLRTSDGRSSSSQFRHAAPERPGPPNSASSSDTGYKSTGDPALDAAINSFFADRRRAKEMRGVPTS